MTTAGKIIPGTPSVKGKPLLNQDGEMYGWRRSDKT
jgi:hypothetical protein